MIWEEGNVLGDRQTPDYAFFWPKTILKMINQDPGLPLASGDMVTSG